MTVFSKLLLLGVVAGQVACASHRVIRDQEYERSVSGFQRGDPGAALEQFPRREEGGFITSVEKSWLGFWQNQPTGYESLLAQARTFDERSFISVSREADYFLFQESEEGYVPSEHEIVILHLLAALEFSQVNRVEDAKVELRRAGYVLERYWDDPALRLWLGSQWAALGAWDEARVDFRRAGELANNTEWLKLAEGPPPRELSLHFYGNGPLHEWTDGSFEPKFLADQFAPVDRAHSLRTDRWFERHLKRNSALRERLLQSNFMAQYLGSQALTNTERGLGKIGTWGIRLTGVVIGVALVGGVAYLLVQSGGAASGGDAAGYLIAAGAAVGYGIWKYGADLDKRIERELSDSNELKMRDLRVYRMVRFLPTWIGLENSATSSTDSATIRVLPGYGSTTRVSLVNHY